MADPAESDSAAATVAMAPPVQSSHKSEYASTDDSESIMTPAGNSPLSAPMPEERPAEPAERIDHDGPHDGHDDDYESGRHPSDTPTMGPTTPRSSRRMSRNPSFSGSSSNPEDWEAFPPLDRLTLLDLLDNFVLPHQLEKIQRGFSAQKEKVRKSRDAFSARSQMARERMVEEWRRRVPSAEEQLDRYRKRMRTSVEKLGRQWNDTKIIPAREKISFIFGVMNIFVSAYLIGGYPQLFHCWYTIQVMYFMPIRWYTYQRRGYHYFLADLCYFVNLLLVASLWLFPSSKRLFTDVFCLAFGNNAVAIVMWRNSLVFHSFDKVTSLFIHIMPCVTLHCILHLLDPDYQRERFPGAWTVKTSPPGSPTAYANVVSMLAWSTIPYAIWQLGYYFFITVRRREEIAAGRPTSFTWLRKSYSKVWIGRIVLALPQSLQEPAFMLIQYLYAVLTMLPCPLWFYSRWASSAFLLTVFTWSIYNGSTFYIDVFGKRFQKELEAMKAEVAKWQGSPEGALVSPGITPHPGPTAASSTASFAGREASNYKDAKGRRSPASPGLASIDRIPLLTDERPAAAVLATSADVGEGARDAARERKAVS